MLLSAALISLERNISESGMIMKGFLSAIDFETKKEKKGEEDGEEK